MVSRINHFLIEAFKMKKSIFYLLFPFILIGIQLISLLCAFIGYEIQNVDSSLYFLGFLIAIFIFMLGGIISLTVNLCGLVHLHKQSAKNIFAPKKFYVFQIIELIFSILWIIFSFAAFSSSMSV